MSLPRALRRLVSRRPAPAAEVRPPRGASDPAGQRGDSRVASAARSAAEVLERRVLLSAAAFVRADDTTGGQWLTAGPGGGRAYGTEGYALANGPSAVPSFATLALVNNNNATWTTSASGAEDRVLAFPGTDADTPRTAACWYGDTGFDVDLNLTDGQAHQVAFYTLDFDAWYARTQVVTITDAATGAALAGPQTDAAFFDGRYLVYTLSGHVTVHFAPTALNAVLSGVFFDPVNAPAPSAVPYAPVGTMAGAPATARGQTYTLNLSAKSFNGTGAIDHWTVNWGDGSDPDNNGTVGQTLAGNPPSVSHVYTSASPAGGWRVSGTVTDAAGATAPVGLGLDAAFAAAGATPGTATGLPQWGNGNTRTAATDPATGRVAVGGHGNPGVALFNPDGTAVPTFNSGWLGMYVHGLAFDPQGRLVVAGFDNNTSDAVVRRLLPDGSADPAFGPGAEVGTVRTDFGGYDEVMALAVGPDGSITTAGGASGGTASPDSNVVLARYTPAGLPDTAFGPNHDGKLNLDTGYWDSARDVALLAGGKILVSGYSNSAWLVARFNADGTPDASFGAWDGAADGRAYFDPTWHNDFAHSLDVDAEVLSNGKILLAGQAAWHVVVARLNADGSPDASFGPGGIRVTPWWAQYDHPVRMRRDAAGGYVLAFNRLDRTPLAGPPSHLAAARLKADGSLDASFGAGGVVDLPWAAADPWGETRPGLALGADGSTYAAGTTVAGGTYAVSRLLPDNMVNEVASPLVLSVAGRTSRTVTLAWNALPGAVRYDVSRGGQVVGSVAGPAFTDAGLHPGTRYQYTITAVDAANNLLGTSNKVTATTATAGTSAAPRPTGLTAVRASSTTIGLQWTNAANGAVGFEIDRATDAAFTQNLVTLAAPAAGAGVVTYTDAGLSPATRYYYRVRAVVPGGPSANSDAATEATADGVHPWVAAAPRATLFATGQAAQLEVLGGDEGGEAGLTYTWAVDGPATVSPNGTNGAKSALATFSSTGTYTFAVTVTNAAGQSVTVGGVAVVVSRVPLYTTVTPHDVTAGPGQSWQFAASANDQFGQPMATGFAWSVGAGGGTVTGSGLYTAPGTVVPGQEVQVYATPTGNPVGAAQAFVHLTPVLAPTGLAAAAAPNRSIRLTWADNADNETGYAVEQSSDGGANYSLTAALPAGSTAFNANDLPLGSNYWFRVRATGAAGDSAYSNPAGATVQAVPPAAPANLTAAAAPGRRVLLAWQYDANAVATFRVEQSADGVNFTQVGTAPTGATAYAAAGLTLGTTYTFRVRATDRDGNSAYSDTAAATAAAFSPAAPTGLRVSAATAYGVTLAWVDNDGGEDGYQVERSADGVNFTQVGTTPPGATAYSASALPAGGVAVFRVRAYRPGEASAYSNAAAAGVVAARVYPGVGVRVTWPAVPGATGYRLLRRADGANDFSEAATPAAGAAAWGDAAAPAGVPVTYRVEAVLPGGAAAFPDAAPVTALAGDPGADADGDGLSTVQEWGAGTDPADYDTDDDRLPDGWESGHGGFDPLAPNNGHADEDGDGLDDIGESARGTDPARADTDGDGATDAAEAAEGSDPTDPADGGQAPADDMKAKFTLMVGDDSGSRSERWGLRVGRADYMAPGYGQVGSADYWFDAGESYPVRLDHLGSALAAPDYDWVAAVWTAASGPGLPHFVVDDNTPKLLQSQTYYGGGTNPTAGKTATLHIPLLDADVDSDNDDGYAAPGRTAAEDRAERDGTTGKWVSATAGDADADGVADAVDYNGVAGLHFVPMVLSLSQNVTAAQWSAISYTFGYQGSAPGAGSAGAVPAGLRVWTKDAADARGAGDYLAPGVAVSAAALGLLPGGTKTVYVEVVGNVAGVQAITIAAQVAGNKWSGTLTDAVHVEAAPVDLDVDSDNNNVFDPPDRTPQEDAAEDGKPGKLLKVNDDDSDRDRVPDWADGFDLFQSGSGSELDNRTAGELFTPMVLEIQTDRPDLARIKFEYDASDPAAVTRAGDGTPDSPYVYTKPGGGLRVWAAAGDVTRDGRGVDDDGDFVDTGTVYTAAELGADDGTGSLWLEGITPSAQSGDRSIRVLVDPDGDGPQGFGAGDQVLLTVAPDLIGVDFDRDNAISFDWRDDGLHRFWVNSDNDKTDKDGLLRDLLPGEEGYTGADGANNRIDSTRDLEDFMRVSLKVPAFFQPSAGWSAKFTWVPGVGEDAGASVNLYDVTATQANQYLINSTVAAEIDAKFAFATLTGTPAQKSIPSAYFLGADGTPKASRDFLLEGVSPGAGDLYVDWSLNGTLAVSDRVALDLRPIKNFYETWTLADAAGNPVGDVNPIGGLPNFANPREVGETPAPPIFFPSTVTTTSDSSPLSERENYGKDYVLLVHGWRMKPEERRDFAATAYKRLYWQGFTGRFGLFSWPTGWMDSGAWGPFPNLLDPNAVRNFDDSEMRAYASAAALRTLIRKLDSDGYSVNLYAHSMGNVVASEALRQEALSATPQKIVHTYVASQAAASAGAYDPTVVQHPANAISTSGGSISVLLKDIPDIYSNFPATRQSYFEKIGLAADKCYNFFNPVDGAVFAETAWPLNQALKPDSGSFHLTYWYDQPTDSFLEIASHPSPFPIGEDVHEWAITLNPAIPYDAYAIMAYAAPSRTRGLGSTAGVGYSFVTAGEVDLSTGFPPVINAHFDLSRDDHSGQFNLDNMTRQYYWNALMKRFGLLRSGWLDSTPSLGSRP